MSRRSKKRRGGVLGVLWRRRLLITMVFFLLASGGLYWKAIKYLEDYTERINTMQAQVDLAENGSDVGRYITLRRNLEILKVEPLLWGLGTFMLLSFATVLIVLIFNTSSSQNDPDKSAKIWEAMMQEKREERQRSRPPRRN